MVLQINPDLILNKQVFNRVKANKNWLGVLCGATGSGKSYFSLAVCEKYFPKFTVDNIVFTVKEYLNKFSDCNPGDIILFDEGEEFNARRGMEQKNVEFGNILSMIRFTQVSSIFTLPDLRQIDVTLVRLMHNYMYTMDIDRRTCPQWQRTRTGINLFEIVHEKIPSKDSRDLKLRYPVMDVVVRNKRTMKCYEKTIKVKELWYNAPSQELLDDYEVLKRKHFNSAMAQSKARLKMVEMKEKNKMASVGIETGMMAPPQNIQQNPAVASPEAQQRSNDTIVNILNGD